VPNPIQQVQSLGQSIWYDNIRRGLLVSGELKRLIDLGVTGLTSNPTIFEKAISGSTDYDDALLSLALAGRSANEIYEALTLEDIQAASDLLRPIFDRTGGADGYASLEVNPHLAHDTEGTVAEAKRLFAALGRPNVMVKVPATPEGIPAVRRLIGEGVNVNVTLTFSLDAYSQVRDAYIGGLEDLARAGGDVSKVASVASFFVSRVDTAVDALLQERIMHGDTEGVAPTLLGRAAIANAKLAYRDFKTTFGGRRFTGLRRRGARVQRPLWASTSTKNPNYSDVMYAESLIGRDTVDTLPEATLTAFLEHGRAAETLEQGLEEAEQVMASLEDAGISMEHVTAKLLADGVKAFADSFDKLIANIEDKRARLLAQGLGTRGTPRPQSLVPRPLLEGLQQRRVVERIWSKDHTVWKPNPAEIADRLGWLSVGEAMREQVPTLEAFAKEVRDAGFKHVVLLGMGGSSLGPEVLRQTFGRGMGYGVRGTGYYSPEPRTPYPIPQLIVLDSTVPAWVEAVTDAIDPGRTLFLVSSKSGSTIEPLSFYKHFRGLVEKAVGKQKAGQCFVAVTDPGTSLARMAQEQGFRRAFLNPPDIGGRYSVLSYFGLAPAALIGVKPAALLDSASRMRQACAPDRPIHDNPGAWLGAVIGAQAQEGRDKLTLVTSPSIESFCLWAEQLIAESTGKEGTGIVPVAGEPLTDAESYGNDRLFVYLRLKGDDNASTDSAVARLESSGQPVVRLELEDMHDPSAPLRAGPSAPLRAGPSAPLRAGPSTPLRAGPSTPLRAGPSTPLRAGPSTPLRAGLGAEFFRWEFATAVAGAILGVNPFDQPDVEESKRRTVEALRSYQRSGERPRLEPVGSLEGLLSSARPGDYLAIMAYLNQTPEVDEAVSALRRRVMERHRIATTFGYGPRFLHSTGQLHKGGPDSGLFLQLTADHERDIPIPGEPYTFGVLADAQATGDLQALQAKGRRVARAHLGAETVAGIRRLADVIS
jgi:transaldolase/glucose-6-phosphate isomerase